MARGRKRKVSSVDSSSPSANAVVVSLTEITEAVSGRKTTESTKVNYRGKLNMIKAWCHTAYPALIISDDSDKTKKEFRSLPLPVHIVIEFFTTRTVPAYYRTKLNGPQDITEATKIEPYGSSTLEGFRSALVDLYKRHKPNKLKFSDELDIKLKELLDGYVKTCNDLQKKGLMKLSVGKRELRRDGYILLCKKLMKFKPNGGGSNSGGSWSASVFGWCFFTLLWSLISRPESVEQITLNMVTWKEDSLTIDENVSFSSLKSIEILYTYQLFLTYHRVERAIRQA